MLVPVQSCPVRHKSTPKPTLNKKSQDWTHLSKRLPDIFETTTSVPAK